MKSASNQVVIGVTHGIRKNTQQEYTIIFYSVAIDEAYGEGVEGKSAYFNKNITHVHVGDSVLFSCSNKNGHVYFDDVYVVKSIEKRSKNK